MSANSKGQKKDKNKTKKTYSLLPSVPVLGGGCNPRAKPAVLIF